MIAKVFLLGIINFGSCVSIIVVNKYILSILKFSFPVSLTLLHLLVTWAVLKSSVSKSDAPSRQAIVLSIAYVLSLVSGNYSLHINNVSIYQCLKICTTPAVIVCDYFVLQTKPKLVHLSAVALLLLGVFMVTVEIKTIHTTQSAAGILIGLSNSIITAFFQVFSKQYQQSKLLSGPELALAIAPVSSALIAVLLPFVEPFQETPSVFTYAYTNIAVLCVLASCLLGSIVTISSLSWMPYVSSLTFNLLGHIKTLTVVTAGCVLYKDIFSSQQIVGLLLAISGLISYSFM